MAIINFKSRFLFILFIRYRCTYIYIYLGMCGARYTEDPDIAESFLMSTGDWDLESFTDDAAGGVGGAGPLHGDYCDNYITILGGFTASSLSQESSGFLWTENFRRSGSGSGSVERRRRSAEITNLRTGKEWSGPVDPGMYFI